MLGIFCLVWISYTLMIQMNFAKCQWKHRTKKMWKLLSSFVINKKTSSILTDHRTNLFCGIISIISRKMLLYHGKVLWRIFTNCHGIMICLIQFLLFLSLILIRGNLWPYNGKLWDTEKNPFYLVSISI